MNRATHWTAAFLAAAVILIGAAVSAQNAPYVGAYEADNFFSTINSNEMAVLRTKKILFASRSSGLNITDGLTRLKNKNAMHNLMNSYVRYDVYDAGGDLTIIPTNVYSSYNFVHFLCSLYPLTKRLEEIETLLRQPLHSFGNQVDVVMVHHAATEVSVFEPYTNSFDTLQAEFPNIKFIYITGGLGGVANTNSAEFSRLVRARYKGLLVGNMGYSAAEASKAIAEGVLDAVAFGTAFLANPDLPARFKAGAPLNQLDPTTFYSPGAKGYTDYPVFPGL